MIFHQCQIGRHQNCVGRDQSGAQCSCACHKEAQIRFEERSREFQKLRNQPKRTK